MRTPEQKLRAKNVTVRLLQREVAALKNNGAVSSADLKELASLRKRNHAQYVRIQSLEAQNSELRRQNARLKAFGGEKK